MIKYKNINSGEMVGAIYVPKGLTDKGYEVIVEAIAKEFGVGIHFYEDDVVFLIDCGETR